MRTYSAANIATCLVFLMDGFNDQHGHMFGSKCGELNETYEHHSTNHGGYIGIVVEFFRYALAIETYLAERYTIQDFPGVFHYEVTEELGAWLFHHPAASHEEFHDHMCQAIKKWFADGLATQSHPVGRTGSLPDLSALANSTLPVTP